MVKHELSPSKQTSARDEGPPTVTIHALPDSILCSILEQLPHQRQRAAAPRVCKRWAAVVRSSPSLHQNVTFVIDAGGSAVVDKTESFLAYLVPRASEVRSLTITARRGPGTAVSPLAWSNITAALALAGPTLSSLSLEWPEELVVSAWALPLQRCTSITLRSSRIVVRPGLHALHALRDVRFRSTQHPLTFVPSHHAPNAALLPPGLLKLRAEGCHLTELPPQMLGLTNLIDLVASDNVFANASLSGLSRLVSLRQCTLMGCRLKRLPSALSRLTNLQASRVLYLDMALEAPTDDVPSTAEQINATLGALPKLSILSLGACHLEEFPSQLASLPLRALYLDDNALSELPEGPYLSSLAVLGCDWRVMLSSHDTLAACTPQLSKLCLMSPGKAIEGLSSPGNIAALVRCVTGHPSLRSVLLPQLEAQRTQLYVGVVNAIVGISQSTRLTVQACTYTDIGNEWLEWLEAYEAEQEQANAAAEWWR